MKKSIIVALIMIFASIILLPAFLTMVGELNTPLPSPAILPQVEPIPYRETHPTPTPTPPIQLHIIHNNDEVVTEPEINEDELKMLAQLIQAEAGNQSYIGKVLVADVVLNRVESPKFKDQNTIEEVIFAPGQFSVVRNGGFKKAESQICEECYRAAKSEMTCSVRYNEGVLYFGTGKFNGKDFFKEDDHWFSY